MLDMIYLVLHVILFHMCSMSMNIHGSVFISLAYCCRFHYGGGGSNYRFLGILKGHW